MEVKRREFLKVGVATLAAASVGVMAAGVAGKRMLLKPRMHRITKSMR